MDVRGLTYARLVFSMKPFREVGLQGFLGSTLRGAFGEALRDLSGFADRDDETLSILTEVCPYLYIFGEPGLDGPGRDATRPFVLRPPEPRETTWLTSERLEFEIVLLGRAVLYAPWVVAAVRLMGDTGMGNARSRFSLESVWSPADGECLWRPGSDKGFGPVPIEDGHGFLAPGIGEVVTVRFVTPLRIRDAETERPPTFERFVRWINRRLHTVLLDVCDETPVTDLGSAWEAAREVELLAIETNHRRLDRKSRRGGWQSWAVRDVELVFGGSTLPAFGALLRAGEVLNVGRSTAFGFGRYQLVE